MINNDAIDNDNSFCFFDILSISGEDIIHRGEKYQKALINEYVENSIVNKHISNNTLLSNENSFSLTPGNHISRTTFECVLLVFRLLAARSHIPLQVFFLH